MSTDDRPVFRPSSVDHLLPDNDPFHPGVSTPRTPEQAVDHTQQAPAPQPEHPHMPRRLPSPEQEARFPHLTSRGEAHMVDVSEKQVTARSASAKGLVLLSPECVAALRGDALPKGDALAVARIAGVMGAKKTADLIPLCHPLPLTGVEVHLEVTDRGVVISTTVRTTHRTGVEMEALTAVCTAALGLVDMVKAVDKHARLTDVRVTAKSGGRSGDWSEQ